ncbi:MAG: cell division protein FtsK [Hydrogenophilales bacterium CG03_land_8_20_14_0_80_62_28]|nr:DNA translocase FtsK [Betaproteobacteria bacterium]OIO78046.1 MAG: cell division protein FtsK [Hydrogenophilaceae bacterium CG1_02_62_390]PIV23835.1 MAG: cell division protein FtsK [Hydrogenophilales bacterium CG03_land_8_20_14_0_80_62_28]PIW37843.1 MAG: cell division protein FtsK [Hydrogenophilales bacterium CG15_BIG_FIL_POST_REV_8_21_14_020_62_31]PIW72389.1 MAG: cell division protein FtsK [Hydrogenophilales bacterium CG12_big_fil_rev_8_21_14_0_65_61_21]PIX02041.1 MAG: cell division protei
MAVNVRRPPPSTKKRKPLAPKVARLLREAWWLVVVGLALFLVMALGSYNPSDPGWSHTGTGDGIANTGGAFGAWLADLLLYLFGASAWWWLALSIFLVWWGYRRISDPDPEHRHGLLVTLGGFLVMLVASCGLETLRLHSLAIALPLGHGGVLGIAVADLGQSTLGFDGSTVALLLVWGIGFSLFTGLSWIAIAEWLGGVLETAGPTALNYWQARQDRQAGLQASSIRGDSLDKERKRREKEPAIRIEPPRQEIPKSKRAEQERQAFLFRDTPDSQLPPLHLLDAATDQIAKIDQIGLEATSRLIERKLLEFGVEVKVLAAYPGPVVTRYEVEPASGVKGAQITILAKDLARSLSVVSIRVVETIPGKNCMALEIPNSQRQTVRLCEILNAKVYAEMTSPLTMALGKDISGEPMVADLAKMPHLLVAGTTGSGKSVAINAMILSLVYKSAPRDVRLILIDPKMLELSTYEGIPHLLAPVVTDMRLAGTALNWCVAEMDKRYKLMSATGVRNIVGFNQKLKEAEKAGLPLTNPFTITPENPERLEHLPYIVVIIDELADLMMVAGKKVEELIARLAQKARAAGIHLILATQRPSVDVITGLIKANIPTRIAFQVSSRIDSRTILDQQGAESLLGQGDMLYLPPGHGVPTRVHGAFVSDDDIRHVTAWLKELGPPNYEESVLAAADEGNSEAGQGTEAEADPLYDEAVAIVLKTRRASISAVQRHLRIGYNRAARLIEAMEQAGLVSPMQSNGNREVLSPNND